MCTSKTIQNGYITFADNFADLIRMNYYPQNNYEFLALIKKYQRSQTEEITLTWQLQFIQNPSGHNDEEIFEIIGKYWEFFNATTHIQSDANGKPIFEIKYTEGYVYNAAIEVIINGIKAHLEEYIGKSE